MLNRQQSNLQRLNASFKLIDFFVLFSFVLFRGCCFCRGVCEAVDLVSGVFFAAVDLVSGVCEAVGLTRGFSRES